MRQIFGFIGATEQNLPTRNLDSLLERYQSEGLTGLMEFSGGGAHIITLLIEGMPALSCRLEELRCEALTPTELTERLPTTHCRMRTSILPLEAVHIAKAMLEWGPPVEIFTAKTSALPELIQQWGTQSQPQIIHILWDTAEGSLMFPGSTPPTNTFYLTKERLRAEQHGLASIQNHPEASCKVMRYTAPQPAEPNPEQLLALKAAFSALLYTLITRYANLVGRGLSNTLMIEINATALRYGLQIHVNNSGITDTHPFPTLQAAQHSYQLLLQDLKEHIGLVVGPRLVETLLRETLVDLAPEAQATLRQYLLK